MELEITPEAENKRLNHMIAITVVILSVFAAMCHIKDENTVQAMERAEAHSIDTWNEYQANKTKQHIAENARVQLQVLAAPGKADAAIARLDGDIAKYTAQSPKLADQAKEHGVTYDRMRFRHDQIDAADAAISTAVSLSAVAALMETFALLWVAWGFGAFGLFMGVNAFAGWTFHPGLLSTLLG
jgi:hypothetical protein